MKYNAMCPVCKSVLGTESKKIKFYVCSKCKTRMKVVHYNERFYLRYKNCFSTMLSVDEYMESNLASEFYKKGFVLLEKEIVEDVASAFKEYYTKKLSGIELYEEAINRPEVDPDLIFDFSAIL